jgi:hypothetical protein
MNGKKFWISALVVTVMYFLLGGFFYAWLMKDWFAAQGSSMSENMNMAWIFVATLSYGLLMAYTFPLGYKGGSAAKEGVRFGILFALIVNLPSSLFMMGMGSWTIAGMVVGLIWEILVGAWLGFITAKVYGGAAKAA